MRFFNQFTFQTPESVELEFTLAGIGNRAYALLIDYLIFWLMIIILLLLWAFLAFEVFPNQNNINLWIAAIQILIIFAVYVGYFVFFETVWQGQTPGKRYVKIRVIRDDGRPIRLQQATLRALLRPIDDLFFLGAFLIMLGKREKRLGDLIAGTIVIQEEQAITSATFPISQEAKDLANLLQTEANISLLLPEHFAVIREYLQRREGMITQAKHELSRKLAYQVKDIIALANIPEGTTASLFLEAVYWAYQQQSSPSPD
jgi:uncharacterized RDD family membrane protein YckC